MHLRAEDFLLQRNFTLSESDLDFMPYSLQNFRVTLYMRLFIQIPFSKANGKLL